MEKGKTISHYRILSKLGAGGMGEVYRALEMRYVYAISGRRTEAQKMLRELQERPTREFIDPYYIAIIYLGLGEQDQTFAWLNKAFGERSFWMLWLKVEPKFDRLRSDARFKERLAGGGRIQLPA